jgi:hypothetical protein
LKGIVFTEFLEMVEDRHSLAMAQRVIDDAALPHAGGYTAVGTYPPGEMVRMVQAYAGHSGQSAAAVLRQFGRHLFASFERQFPDFFGECAGPLELLESVDQRIHGEVRKLYPDAELPSFDCHRPTPDSLVMVYRSSRGLADLAEGLIEACLAAGNTRHRLARENLDGGAGTHVRFTVHLGEA